MIFIPSYVTVLKSFRNNNNNNNEINRSKNTKETRRIDA